MTRVPPASRERIPEPLRAAFDAAIQRPGRVPRFGNYTTMLYSPEACLRLHHWADSLRNDSVLPPAIRELALLVTARALDSQYIWNAHADAGRRAGLSPGLVEALRDKAPLPAMTSQEASVIKYGQEYYRTHRVSPETFQDALEQLGVQGLVELTMLMGFSGVLAFNLHAFDIDLPDDRTEPVLPI